MIKATFYCLLAGLCLLGSVQTAFSQKGKLFTGSFNNATFDEVVEKIEDATDYHFFYKHSDLDSIHVTFNASQISVIDLLQQILQRSPFHFTIDGENIFITKYAGIQTDLPADFFNRNKTIADTGRKIDEPFFSEPVSKDRTKLPVENKLFEIGNRNSPSTKSKITLAGYVRDAKSGESITGASIYVDSLFIGVVTDQFGYYSITLPKGRHLLQVNSVGMKNTSRNIALYSDGKLNIELVEYVPSLKTVVVMAERRSNTRGLQMGVDRLSIKTIKQVPVVFGEADILKVVMTLPGVTSVGEASAGFNVRGGSTDENLILFNDATIYNPSHLFGFFSAFNPDVVKNVELYKSAIPERYGGRLSSVLDVTTKEGNSKKFSGIGGVGPLTSKITVEGPIVKDKTSFIASARTSYSDWILHKIPNETYQNSAASFYDADIHINHTINNKNNIYITGYLSYDQFRLNRDTTYNYGNRNINLKWKHNYNNQFYSIISGGIDHYQYSVAGNNVPVNAYKLAFDINQKNFKADFSYTPNNKHTIDFGINSIYYQLHPGSFSPVGTKSLVVPDTLPGEQALESALYLGDQYAINPKLSLNLGLRFSVFNYLGPHDQYQYTAGVPKDVNSLVDTSHFKKGKIIKTYGGPEYRFAMRYSIDDSTSVKLSYNTLRQYIHMLSNTSAISPTDVWKLSDPNIKPQTGDQISLGFYKNFKSNTIETSVEVYYKHLYNFLDYKSGAVLVMNHHIETDVINSRGKAYGVELMIKKTAGKLNGWLSYTYSRTFLRTDDSLAGEQINGGTYYPANFDKPHNINFISNYRLSHRFSFSFNLIYSTGRPITLPIAIFNLGGAQRVYYSDRNQYRIPDYFRSDISVNIEGNHKIKKLTHNSWSFGVYNLTARKNAYSVYFIEENGLIKGYKLSIFGTAIPFITYNFRF